MTGISRREVLGGLGIGGLLFWFTESDSEGVVAPVFSGADHLEIPSGETVTIESDDSETYEWIRWESGGTLEWESGGKIALAADTE